MFIKVEYNITAYISEKNLFSPATVDICYLVPHSIYTSLQDLVEKVHSELKKAGLEGLDIILDKGYILIADTHTWISATFYEIEKRQDIPETTCIVASSPRQIASDMVYLYITFRQTKYKPRSSVIMTYTIDYKQDYRYRETGIRELKVVIEVGLPINNMRDIFNAVEDVVAPRMGFKPSHEPVQVTHTWVGKTYYIGYSELRERRANIDIFETDIIPVVVYFPDLEQLKRLIRRVIDMTPPPEPAP